VLEGVPSILAGRVTTSVRIPTIGIGAGPQTDGQVLVFHDFLGLTTGKAPKFVKRYANLADDITRAAQQFADEVRKGTFPGPEHEYSAEHPKDPAKPSAREVKYGAGT
jgi:3-methyl-2-oxobutanoate hydroxymethyltransferase